MRPAEALFTVKSRTVRRGSGRLYAQLLEAERMPRTQLQLLQNTRAAAIARFAADGTRFYGRLFREHGIDVSRLDDSVHWQRIPVLDRATVKAHHAEIVSIESNAKTARDAKTGGSTGEPLRTQQDNRVPMLAMAWRMYRWWGVQPWDNLARIGRWGFGTADTVKNIVSWWPTRQVYLDATLFGAESMRAFHRSILRTRPALLEGYVGAMLEFADFLTQEGLTVPPPKAIATTAAPLTENARRRLESVYQAPVYDEYRGSEINWLAGECNQHDGLHVFADMRRLEVVDEEGMPVPNGTVGDIVVTDLTNRVFPLIRYRLGDRGSLIDRECRCGVTLPLMAQPEGRKTDVIRLPSGSALNHGLNGMFGHVAGSVRLFQIHQLADYSIRIRVVRGDDADAERSIEEAVDRIRRRIADEVPVAIDYVDALPYTGGKTKYVISDVPAS